MTASAFEADGREYTITVARPGDVSHGGWAGAQRVLHAAYSEAFNHVRTPEAIAKLVQLGNLAAFRDRRIDLTLAQASGDLHKAQGFTRERVAIVADEAARVVGLGYVANNISGPNRLVRAAKRLTASKDYRWIKEIAVLPEEQGHGIGRTILTSLVLAPGFRHGQIVTAYVAEDNQSGLDFFKDAGFTAQQPLLDTSLFHGIPSDPELLRHTHANPINLVDNLTRGVSAEHR